MISRDRYLRSIEWHLQTNLGVFEKMQLLLGPMKAVAPDFTVLKFEPNTSRTLYTYATCGMSDISDTERIECFILSPAPDPSLCELLTVVAWYHRTGASLGLEHTVNFGRPWLPESDCANGLFSLPYLDGPKLEWLECDGVRTRILWLIPITIEERDFKIHFGLEGLESRFESTNFDYANPFRKSVVRAHEVGGRA
jgi:hypothetical protein